MSGAIPPLPNVFVVWCLVKHRDDFTVYLYFNPEDGSSTASETLLSNHQNYTA
jgi:hypothetical protein